LNLYLDVEGLAPDQPVCSGAYDGPSPAAEEKKKGKRRTSNSDVFNGEEQGRDGGGDTDENDNLNRNKSGVVLERQDSSGDDGGGGGDDDKIDSLSKKKSSDVLNSEKQRRDWGDDHISYVPQRLRERKRTDSPLSNAKERGRGRLARFRALPPYLQFLILLGLFPVACCLVPLSLALFLSVSTLLFLIALPPKLG